ncbi:MAG TPA: 3-oxoacyl-ACP reductase FabG [Pseudogracilibacillus sp.]|nr:3-oxoacyl-ACP reductase FabG [Pseudogracilibacillus sp.]
MLSNKTALITGGCNGIGFATAAKFLTEGANVVIIDLDKDEMNASVQQLKQYGSSIKGMTANVSQLTSAKEAVQFTVNHFGKIDILVNNAGIVQDAQLLKMTEEAWDNVINVNLKGVYMMAQAAGIEMKENKSGVILNASSVVSFYGNFGQTNYMAAKSGVNGMTKTWARELGKYNIRVNAVAPGFVKTEMVEQMPEKVLASMKEKSLLQAMGEPEDIANAYAFLASDQAKFITGTVLQVDGGLIP